MEQIPVISINLSGLESNPGFKLTLPLVKKVAYGAVFGDILMKCVYRMRPYELEEGMKATMSIIEAIRPGQSVGIFIGPEGGFEEQEIGQARNAGAVPVTLGRRILRTETAGITTLSILMYHLECAEVQ